MQQEARTEKRDTAQVLVAIEEEKKEDMDETPHMDLDWH